ncbi:MAG: translation elongation factor Ts [Treponema sp.]|nr:translation elongation factor Ts [Treponema sp.]MCL2271368.1 translation elongation factor Ts [Treponema sp.]
MAEITAADVKKLRDKTGAGPMECKNALVSTGGDFAAAEKILKEKGLAALEKRTGRAINEGKIFVKIKSDLSMAVLVELNAETDFVARNPDFVTLGGVIADKALEKQLSEPDDELRGMVQDLATKIRENMGLKRLCLVKASSNEYLTHYIHGDGNIGIVVKCESDKPEVFKNEDVKSFIFTLALHIAAFNPAAIDRSKVDQNWLKEQEEIFKVQMEKDEKLKGKPDNVLAGILQGKVNKYLSEICLMEQGYVKDEKLTVAKAIEECGKKAGAKLSVVDYVYYKVGVEA